MVVAVDMGTVTSMALGRIEKDRPALFAWQAILKVEVGVEILVSDDFNSCSTAAQRLELEQQICRFDYLCWVNRLLSRLPKKLDDRWDDLLDEVRLLIKEMPRDGGTRLYQLYRRVRSPPRVYNQPMHPLARLQ